MLLNAWKVAVET